MSGFHRGFLDGACVVVICACISLVYWMLFAFTQWEANPMWWAKELRGAFAVINFFSWMVIVVPSIVCGYMLGAEK